MINIRVSDTNGNIVKEKDVSITNIDKEKPNTFNVSGTSTSNSITASKTNATDVGGSGIDSTSYQYAIYSTSTTSTVLKEWQASTSFTGLTAGTTYYLQGRVYDNAGNVVTTSRVAVKTQSIDKPTLTSSIYEWTNGSVVVTVGSSSSMQLQYQIGTSIKESGWINCNSGTKYTFTANGIISARLYDGTSGGTYVSLNISNIDKTAPGNFTVSGKSTSNSITASRTNATDTQSGIKTTSYQYALYSTSTTSNVLKGWQTSTSFTGLTAGTTYYLQGRVYDNAGNVITTSRVAVKTIENTVGVSSLTRGDYVTYNNQKWVVLHGASDSGTNSYVEIYYPSLTTTYTLTGQSGYNSMISTLNAQASSSTYYKSTYAQQARHFGSHPTSPTTNATVKASYGDTSTLDTHYTTDVSGYNSAGVINSQTIWMASRYVSHNDLTLFYGRRITTTGSITTPYMYSIYDSGYTYDRSFTYGLSPVISLKSTLKITGGSGTSSSPYTLGT